MSYRIASLALIAAVSFTPAAQAAPKGCPPGLAKKSVPCVPPGQAKKVREREVYREREHHDRYDGHHAYRRGDIVDDYVIIVNPERYGLDPRGTYYRSRGQVIRVDEDTRKVLDLIGAVAAILN